MKRAFGVLALLALVLAAPVFAQSGVTFVPSPQTSATPSFTAKTANTFLAGPTTGSPAEPTFRVFSSSDFPTSLNLSIASLAITPASDALALAVRRREGGTARIQEWQQGDNTTLSYVDHAGAFIGNVTGALTGNASTATALAANPADCSADTFATTIAASGALTCAGVTGTQVANTPAGNVAATTAQAAVNELDTEKLDKTGGTLTGSITVPDLSFSGTTTTGLHPKSLTTTERDAVNPAAAPGDTIYNSTTQRVEVYDGTAWHGRVRLDGDTMTGSLLLPEGGTAPVFASSTTPGTGLLFPSGAEIRANVGGAINTRITNQPGIGLSLRSTIPLSWSAEGIVDLLLLRNGAANPQWGLNSATPAAQTHNLAPSSRATTDADVAGASATIQPGDGTGTGGSGSIIFRTAPASTTGTAANTMRQVMAIYNSGIVTFDANMPRITMAGVAIPPGTMTAVGGVIIRGGWSSFAWTNAMVAALGANLTGDITVCTLPAKTVVKNMYVVINTPDTSANALTVSVGRTGAGYVDYIAASDAKAAASTVYGDGGAERGANLTGYDLPLYTGTTAVVAHFTKTTTNLDTVLGSTGTVIIETASVP